uniref:SLBB domain-containing protein n=1 Tax=Algoriphagus sp. TaxID=1872435 RepID=UPI00404794EB
MKISKYYIFVLYLTLLQLINFDLFSQTTSNISGGTKDINIGSLSVDYQRAKARGMSDDQFSLVARQNGYNDADIKSVINSGSSNVTSKDAEGIGKSSFSNQSSPSDLRRLVGFGGEDVFQTGESSMSLNSYEKKIFGYEVFNNKNVNFSPNLNMATPMDYVVGPGDQLIIQIYGIAEGIFTLTVSPEGNINIPGVGVVHVGSLQIDAAKVAIQQKLSSRYPGIGGSSPSTFVMVTIGNIRSIKVNMVGELNNPGTYQLPSFSSVFNALYVAGGPTVKGSFRKVQVFRANILLIEIDLYEFLTKGITSKNIRLEDNDVILVPSYSKRIELRGEVRREGFYESIDGESLSQIISTAGGFTERAYQKNISVQRLTDQQQQLLTVEEEKFTKFNFRDGDVVMIGEVLDRFENRVQVIGAVNRGGDFELKAGMRLKDLLDLAGGLKPDALWERAMLYRTLPNLEQEIIPIDLKKVIGDDPKHNLILQREDYLSIKSVYDSRDFFYVKIEGEVNNSGFFPYAENLTLKDLILEAGGFKESASLTGIEIVRRIPNDLNSIATVINIDLDRNFIIDDGQSMKLEPFDVVYVLTQAELRPYQHVYVSGELNRTGKFVLDKPLVYLSELLDRAGGVAISGDLRGALLLRRTIFYKIPQANDQYLSDLMGIRKNFLDTRNLSNTESNKLQVEKIDKKIQQLQGDKNLSLEADQSNFDISDPLVSNRTDLLIKDQTIDQLNNELQNIDELKNNLQVNIIRGLNNVSINENKYEFVSISLEKIVDPTTRSAYDIPLNEGDILFVPTIDRTVRVGGEVLYPVAVKFTDNQSFKSYINNAGGFKSEALRKKSYLIESNGTVIPTKLFLGFTKYPKVTSGSSIFVPKDTKIRNFNIDRVFTLVSSLVTTYLLVSNLSN